MKNLLLFVFLLFCFLDTQAQESRLSFRPLTSKPIKKEKLSEINTLKDLNAGFPESWIEDAAYISSVVTVTVDGKRIKAQHRNNILTKEQKTLLLKADLGTNVNVIVKYKNTNSVTKDIDIKTMNFDVTVIPQKEALFEGGYDKLSQFFEKKVLELLSKKDTDKIVNAVLRITIDENGKVTKSQISTTSGDIEIDKIILRSVDKMPDWKPAENAKGEKVQQIFEFSLGNNNNC